MASLRRVLTAAAASAAVSLAWAAQAATTWDYYSFTGVTHPITKYQMDFAKEVEKRTNGELKIVVRPAGELPFRATEAVTIAAQGQVQISSAYLGFSAGTVPITGLSGLPFLVRDYAELQKIWPIIDKYTKPEYEKLGVKTLFYFSWPPQNLFGNGKPIRTAADFAGRKIRTTDASQGALMSRLGATTVTLTTAEVPVAMERGLVEGVLTANFNLVGAKWTEFVKWAWYGNVNIGGPNFELVNLAAYNALPAAVREKLDQVAAEWGPKMNKEIEAFEVENFKQVGEQFKIEQINPTPETVAEIQGKVATYWDDWAKQVGPSGVEALKEVRAALGR